MNALELTDEERDAFGKVFEWMAAYGAVGSDTKCPRRWRKMDEGYKEACILANLLLKFSEEILKSATDAGKERKGR